MVIAGYKHTDIGVIPKSWDLLTVNDTLELLTDFEANGSFETVAQNVRLYDSSNFAWYVRATDLEKNSNLSEVKYVDRLSYAFLKKTPLFGGEVLITKRGEIGKIYYFNQQYSYATLAPNMYLLKLNTKVVVPQFVYYFFKSNIGNKLLLQKNASSTLGALYKDDVKAIYFPIPPKEEQKAIAKSLSDTDELISSLEKLIAKKEAIKQGTMQQLLTGKKRLSGFSGEWEEKRLGNLCEMSSGGTPSTKISQYYGGNISWLSISDITDAGKYIFKTERSLTSSGLANSSAKLFNQGILLLAMYASIGKCCIPKVDISTSQAILGIKTNTQVDTEFLYYYFLYSKNKLASSGQQGTQSNLNKGMVEDIKLNLPTLEEQNAISQILSDMDNEIETLKSQLSKTKAIKDGMMRELLTGKTRLLAGEKNEYP